MKQSYYLVKDDNTTVGASSPFCGSINGCTSNRHEFTIRANETQTVYLSAFTWPTRSYPKSCVVADGYYAGPADATHMLYFRSKDDSKDFPGARTWMQFGQSTEFNGFEMEDGDELTVIIEMDWREGSSRDFSLVSWATGSQPVAITADHEESNTFQGAMPLTVRQSTDGNAANESGADICAANP
jgi:hypothetical protein